MSRPLTIWMPAVRAGSGSDVFTQRLADALSRRGHRVLISWFPHWTEVTPDILRGTRVPSGTDVVHANSAYAFAFARTGIPLVVTEHHYILDPAYRPFKSRLQHAYHRLLIGSYLRRSYAAADALTTDSCFTADVLRRVVGIDTAHVIPLWVDYDVYAPRDQWVRPSGSAFRLLFVGNASRRKGADVIVPLAQRLGSGFEFRCTSGLRASGDGTNVPSNVTMLGRLTTRALVQEYQDCDAVLVPSRYEGFGYSALEGMACGKPIVGFRCGAIEEVVGEAGLLCDVDDLEALAEACRRLSRDRSIAGALGLTGRQRAVACFSETVAIDQYINLYSNATRRH